MEIDQEKTNNLISLLNNNDTQALEEIYWLENWNENVDFTQIYNSFDIDNSI